MTHKQNVAPTAAETKQEEKKGIFSVISLPAVLAAILTSITSFLFSSKLGLTGSLVGAGIGSAVSTIASQVYNAMINSSVDKVHDLTDQMHQHAGETGTNGGARHSANKTKQLVVDLQDVEFTEDGSRAILPIENLANNESAAASKDPLFYKVFAVATVAAMLALLCYGYAVHVATNGKGIGPTPESVQTWSQPATETQDSAGSDAAESAEQKDSGETPKSEDAAVEEQSGVDATATDAETTQQTSTADQPSEAQGVTETPTEGEQVAQDSPAPTATETSSQETSTTTEPATGA